MHLASAASASDAFSFESSARAIAVVGAPRDLMFALAGLSKTAGGTLEVLGLDPALALAQHRTALARMDTTLPAESSVRSYLMLSARLAGATQGAAVRTVDEAIEIFLLARVADLPAAKLVLPVQNATRLAAAFVTGAELLLFEDPTAGQPEDIAHALGEVLVKLLQKRKYMVFGGAFAAQQPLWRSADEALVFRGGAFAAHATAAELARVRAVSVVAVGNTQQFASELEQRGFRAEPRGEGRWLVDLGDAHRVQDLLQIAHKSGSAIIELTPLFARIAAPARAEERTEEASATRTAVGA